MLTNKNIDTYTTKYIFKFDNEFNRMITLNNFNDFISDAIYSLLLILGYSNKPILDLNLLIKDLKKMNDEERYKLLNHDTIIFTNKMWFSILYVCRKTNRCIKENCKHANCIYGLHNNDELCCYYNLFSETGCSRYNCNKKHLVDGNFWKNIKSKLIHYNFSNNLKSDTVFPLINNKEVTTTTIKFEKSFISLLNNIEENAKFDALNKKSFINKYPNKKIKKEKIIDEDIILDYESDVKGSRANLEVMLLMSNLSNNIDDTPKVQTYIKNKIIKENKKKKVTEMTDEEYQKCLEYQEHDL
jgi:hypothetical protein